MANIDTIEIPWDKFPAMKVWRVVKKATTDHGKFMYLPANSKYKGYPHRKDAIAEAQRLTAETKIEHVTIQAWLVAVEKAPESEAHNG